MITKCLGAVWLGSAIFCAPLLAEESDKPGLEIGRSAPLFTLKDQTGKEISLKTLLQKGPVVVVFHRSADWCLYCKLQMVQLQRHLREIESNGAQVVGISYDSTEILRGFAKRSKIQFPLLSDDGSKTIDAYGVLNRDATGRFEGSAYHATFVVDQAGIIRTKMFQLSYQEKPVVDALLNAVREARHRKEESKL